MVAFFYMYAADGDTSHRKLSALSAMEHFVASWVHGKCTSPEPQFPLFPTLTFWSAVSSADVLRPGRGHTWLQRASRGNVTDCLLGHRNERSTGVGMGMCILGSHGGDVVTGCARF